MSTLWDMQGDAYSLDAIAIKQINHDLEKILIGNPS